jgi:hypothetical protein
MVENLAAVRLTDCSFAPSSEVDQSTDNEDTETTSNDIGDVAQGAVGIDFIYPTLWINTDRGGGRVLR